MDQEDSDYEPYSMSSQVCPNEQNNFKIKYGIDLDAILKDGSTSERPTPCAKKDEIANYCDKHKFGSMKNRS